MVRGLESPLTVTLMVTLTATPTVTLTLQVEQWFDDRSHHALLIFEEGHWLRELADHIISAPIPGTVITLDTIILATIVASSLAIAFERCDSGAAYTDLLTNFSQVGGGHTDGHTNGHTDGYTNGYTGVHTGGHTEGYTDGHTDGHTDGSTLPDVRPAVDDPGEPHRDDPQDPRAGPLH